MLLVSLVDPSRCSIPTIRDSLPIPARDKQRNSLKKKMYFKHNYTKGRKNKMYQKKVTLNISLPTHEERKKESSSVQKFFNKVL